MYINDNATENKMKSGGGGGGGYEVKTIGKLNFIIVIVVWEMIVVYSSMIKV